MPRSPNILDLPDQPIRRGIEDGEHRSRAQIHSLSIQADDAIVRLRPDVDAFDQFAILGVDDEISAVRSGIPPAGRYVNLFAVHRDGRSIAARFVGLFPDDFFGLQVESSQATIRGTEINAMRFQVSGKSTKAFGENGDVDPPNKLMSVVDIED